MVLQFFFFYFSRWLFSWNCVFNIRHWFSPFLYWLGKSLNAWFYCQHFILFCSFLFLFFHHIAQTLCKNKQPFVLHLQVTWTWFTLCHFFPLLPLSADTAAVLHMCPSVRQFIHLKYILMFIHFHCSAHILFSFFRDSMFVLS